MDPRRNPSVILFDRLHSLKRTASNGEVVERGSTGGANEVKIIKREGGTNFLRVSCIMQDILLANVVHWPSGVSEDGRTITLWLEDYSRGRTNGYRRKFELTFFTEYAAELFFDVFVEELGNQDGQLLSYQEFMNGVEEEEEEEEERTNGEEEKSEKDGNEESDKDGKEESEKDGNDLRGNDDDNGQESIFEIEQNMGESQSLFNPYYPCFD